ncbi:MULTISPECIES: carbamoyltransferase C-terminal domain-containing protein [Fischerella]|uniref:carbamoyltransferase C-terminal domain-containing protein n=1 Tax=Fischerella TaxID=1190 RepID=UPI000300E3E7|nr:MULTISPECIES: carbamoyltransferase C-terminal domain-containing protein [Fischerella]MBD2431680.1 methyltransferase [Fischerella sp. FACHB-380]
MTQYQYHMGINLGHERSVAIAKDGEIVVAIEQERLDRHKYSPGYMLHAPGVAAQMQIPAEAMRYCLDACNITLSDLATITANMPGHDCAPDILRRVLPAEIVDKVIRIPSHHLAHAYSAYWPSGFDQALILVVDASGSTTPAHCTESYTLYEGRGQTITTLHNETVAAHLAQLSTLGFVYEYITRKAGFVTQVGNQIQHAEAGKLMGLAPFGGEQPNWHRWIQTTEESFSLKISAYDIFLEVAALEKRYDTGEGKPYLRPYLVDLAYKVQKELEQALLHIVNLAIKRTGLRKLCIAGGVGLNSVANYELLRQLQLDDIFIFPAAGDSGIAAGCALWAYNTISAGQKRVPLTQATLGRRYDFDQVCQAIRHFQDSIEVEELTPDEMIARSAQVLAQGSIVARFEGGAEYGPRALGHRSIMADPTFKRMKDILNMRVKFREAFRPFAPVIPLEAVSQVFEQNVAAPFMLLVSPIKPEFHEQIPAVTHVDGTGRVQTVTEQDNPYFYRLCYKLVEERQGTPVLLNTSFNVAGQPIVETPLEAIATFLGTDIDYLALENFWICKRRVPIRSYEDHLAKVGDVVLPHGLPLGVPDVTDLMAKLDRALFFGQTDGCPWSPEELQVLSAKGAQYKETSLLFPETPFYGSFQTKLSSDVILLLNPLGKSTLVDLKQQVPPSTYTFEEVKLLLAVFNAPESWLEQMRIDLRLTHFEFTQRIEWAKQQLGIYRLESAYSYVKPLPQDSPLPSASDQTFAPFENENFSARRILGKLYEFLHQTGYNEANICNLLGVSSQQQIEPTYLHYYDRYRLPQSILGDLIRLFLLRCALTKSRLQEIFGNELFSTLCSLGMLIQRDQDWASQVDLFAVAGLYVATDHRYMILAEDHFDEDVVMYVGMDSMGLVYTAPQYPANRVLDLCCGSGIQSLVASRYAQEVIGVDINPRAIRFARFNAQLNGIYNINFYLGNLYEPTGGYFDTILVNPPFVPSPSQECCFRDGGMGGEEILARIITESANKLAPQGRLFIVTDLVNLQEYESKLEQWWQGEPAHKLVLNTADRNDILFSVPHCHTAFNQTLEEYNIKLDQWLENFHSTGLKAVNFGYILICQVGATHKGSYYSRTIHNPNQPIHQQVQEYFRQRQLLEEQQIDDYFLALSPDLRFRLETNPRTGERQIELFSPNNPYFTTYPISEQMYRLLQDINKCQPKWAAYATAINQDWLHKLIYKGILYLTSETPNVNMNRRLNDPPSTEGLKIEELQTKTTPTCISSYLR